MSIPALLLNRIKSILIRWWKKQSERRRRERAWKEVPDVKPPQKRIEYQKKMYNRNIHSQPMKEEHEERIQK